MPASHDIADLPDAKIEPDYVLKFFSSEDKAIAYRNQEGCGGWIFADESGFYNVLFPFGATPTYVAQSPATKGRAGRLV